MTQEKMGVSPLGITGIFLRTGTCSETLARVVDRSFNNPMEVEEHAAAPLAGGLANYGYQCGMLWGGALAGGAQAYKRYGPGATAQAAAVEAAIKLVASFRAYKKYINCLEITDLNFREKIKLDKLLKFFIKGGPVGCLRMAIKYASVAFTEITASLAEAPAEVPAPPVSCAALLAQKLGASDKHVVMAAGLAGGIGLSGGGCGALGAAIWLGSMEASRRGASYKELNALGGEIMEKFIKGTDYELECSAIVGREFRDVSDHAAYLQGGGCAEVIERLVAAVRGPAGAAD